MTIRNHARIAAQTTAHAAVLATALTLAGMGPACATDSGVYLGVGYGQAKYDLGDESDISTAAGIPASFNVDDSDTSWSLSLGYRFNPYIAVEGGYSDFGQASIALSRSFVFSGVTFTNVDGGIASKGPTLALVGAAPFGNWELYGKLGAFFAKTDLTVRVRGRTNSSPTQLLDSSETESANTVETMAAIGLGYTVANHYHFRLEWMRIPKVGDEEKTGEGDVTQLSLGFHYRF